MTQENKQLLLKDLCARLPYGVKADFKQGQLKRVKHEVEGWYIDEIKDDNFIFIKPYLRPMSSMTEEESSEYNSFSVGEDWISNPFCCVPAFHVLDWLNCHHFDYRGLIEKGLALEAPEGMYK